MSWAEIGETTLPQARALLAEFHEVDGSREVAKTIVDVVTAIFGGSQPKPTAPTEAPDAGLMLDGLYDAVKSRMREEGWTPPVPA